MEEQEILPESQELPPQFELEQPEDYSQYLLYSKSEILSVLRTLVQKGSMITVHFDQGQSFFLTSAIALSADNREMILDIGSNEEMNNRALRAKKLIFTTLIDKVKIQFSLTKLSQIQSGGRLAFVGAIPERLLRLQRREFFRLSTPIANPIRLNAMHRRADGSALAIELPLLDISGGGVGLMVALDLAVLFQRGDMLNDCRMMLPDEGLLLVTLCVRNQFDVSTRSGSRYVRLGCEFVNLSAQRLTVVQRYITRVERERKARLNGLA
jgi:flagellar brake protein